MKVKKTTFRIGDAVFLKEEFKNGSTNPEEKRIYPAGTGGKVHARKRRLLRLEMDDPPGLHYSLKIINIDDADVVHDVAHST